MDILRLLFAFVYKEQTQLWLKVCNQKYFSGFIIGYDKSDLER